MPPWRARPAARQLPRAAPAHDTAVDPVTDTIYQTNADDFAHSGLSVISGRTNVVTAEVGSTFESTGVAADPAANTVYLTQLGPALVPVVSGTTDSVTATIRVGRGPVGIAVDPVTRTAYVFNLAAGAWLCRRLHTWPVFLVRCVVPEAIVLRGGGLPAVCQGMERHCVASCGLAESGYRRPALGGVVPGPRKLRGRRDRRRPAPQACMTVGSSSQLPGEPAADWWTGTAWRQLRPTVPVGPRGALPATLTSVSCTTTSNCMAVGPGGSFYRPDQTLAERWNDTTWNTTGIADPSGGQRPAMNAISRTRPGRTRH